MGPGAGLDGHGKSLPRRFSIPGPCSPCRVAIPTVRVHMYNCSPGEAISYLASQQIPRVLWNPKVHYRVQKSPPLVPIPSQLSPVYALLSYFLRSTLILSSHSRLSLPSLIFRSALPTNTHCAFFLCPMRATDTTYLIILYLIPIITFSELCVYV